MNFFKKIFSSEDVLADLVSNVEKLNLDRYTLENNGEAYIYNGYLIVVAVFDIRWESQFELYEFMIYEYKEGKDEFNPELCPSSWRYSWGRRGLIARESIKGDKKQTFLAACKRVDDIILAKEGF